MDIPCPLPQPLKVFLDLNFRSPCLPHPASKGFVTSSLDLPLTPSLQRCFLTTPSPERARPTGLKGWASGCGGSSSASTETQKESISPRRGRREASSVSSVPAHEGGRRGWEHADASGREVRRKRRAPPLRIILHLSTHHSTPARLQSIGGGRRAEGTECKSRDLALQREDDRVAHFEPLTHKLAKQLRGLIRREEGKGWWVGEGMYEGGLPRWLQEASQKWRVGVALVGNSTHSDGDRQRIMYHVEVEGGARGRGG